VNVGWIVVAVKDPHRGERGAKASAPRGYTSPVRQEQAARTRARIVAAATDRFLADGYGRTTIAAVARQAEVSVDTVYAVFGTKARLLTAVIDARLAPAGDANVMDRAEAQVVADEVDQRVQIRRFAEDIAGVLERVRGVYEILRSAGSVEPEMAAIHAEMDGYRLTNMRRALSWISARGPLRLDDDEAATLLWTMASPDVARMLLDGQGWTVERYVDWLDATLARLLLPEP